jgi:putative ABC transport system permease protein
MRWADRLFRWLIGLFPADFRAEFGRDMEQTYRHERADVSGNPSLQIRLWLRSAADIFRTAPREHAERLLHDARHGLRMLLRAPRFSLLAIGVLGLGIGASTAMFALVESILLRPLPFPGPDRLFSMLQLSTKAGSTAPVSPAVFFRCQDQLRRLGPLGFSYETTTNLSGDGEPERLTGYAVSAGFFEVLATPPAMGRVLERGDENRGSAVVLSHALWQRRFGGDPSAIGRQVKLNGEIVTIVGIMPASFVFPSRDAEFWKPQELGPEAVQMHDQFLSVIARVPVGVALQDAKNELTGVMERLERELPQSNTGMRASLIPLRETMVQEARRPMLVLFGGVLLVLLLACANVAGLLTVRTLSRSRELSVRAALGAGRLRLVRQLLTESTLLAIAAALAGWGLYRIFLDLFLFLVPSSFAFEAARDVQPSLLIFAGLLAIISAALFGAIPALSATRRDVVTRLKNTASSVAGGRRTARSVSLLLAAEVGLALVLLLGAGLLLKTWWRYWNVEPGFATDHRLTMRVILPYAKYDQPAKKRRFFGDLLDRLQQLPGVQSAAATSFLPLTMGDGGVLYSIAGQPGWSDFSAAPRAVLRAISPDYFRAMQIRLVAGRAFDRADGPETRVAIISRSLAQRHWPNGESPIGRQIKRAAAASDFPWSTIVGVVDDIQSGRLNGSPAAQLYEPYTQYAGFFELRDVILHVSGNPLDFAAAARAVVREVDPEQPVSNLRSMQEIVASAQRPARLNASVLGGFAAVALLLSGIGIYAAVGQAVTQRKKEIAIRMAVGAQASSVYFWLTRWAILPALGGVAIGLAVAVTFTGWLRSMLFGVTPFDPAVFVAAPVAILALSVIAASLPARRALAIDPADSLREE